MGHNAGSTNLTTNLITDTDNDQGLVMANDFGLVDSCFMGFFALLGEWSYY